MVDAYAKIGQMMHGSVKGLDRVFEGQCMNSSEE